jgi:CAAX protease family protein
LNARRFFFHSPGALRAPWRLVVFTLATIGCALVVIPLASPPIAAIFAAIGLSGSAVQSSVELLALLAATAVALRWVDRRPWSDAGLDRTAARPALLGKGLALGFAAIALPIVALVVVRWLRREPAPAGSWPSAAFRSTLFLLPAAFVEELLVRGYAFAVLREALNWRWALGITSVFFGLLHLNNPGANVGSVLLVTLAGVFLGGVLVATRSLYAAWMAHFAWNWTMAVLFHTAVSGVPLETPGYRYVDAGPDWATGGDWGPEGGVPAAVGMSGALVYLYSRRGRSVRREET